MKLTEKTKKELDQRYQKISKTPASFGFFVAIHDFIDYIESDSILSKNISSYAKLNSSLNFDNKYKHLKKIHQGLKDAKVDSDIDLGHERLMTVVDLNKIKNKDLSENNSFWKKRELFRRISGEIYEIFIPKLV